jgi:hypothetical protein
MQFTVTRTSRGREESPCEGAQLLELFAIDTRNADFLESPTFRVGWEKQGMNHRIEHGRPARGFLEEHWVVEIGTLRELLAFPLGEGQRQRSRTRLYRDLRRLPRMRR